MSGVIESVKSYIEARNPDFGDIGRDLDILDNRLVDSLQFVEFIMFIQEAAGISIDFETLDIEDFRTLDRIEGMIAHARGENVQAASA